LRKFKREAPEGVRFDCSRDALLADSTIQNLIADSGLLAIAQRYLGTAPILDIVAMWWHSAFGHEPDSEAAQYFHFDMDRIKWIKFFFYVTDVNEDSGPHVFVRGSHRTGGVPKELLRKGYVRLMDQEIASRYPAADIIEFIGARGTLIIEDTRGLHKGKRVVAGDRLLFQLEFTSSLFGAPYKKWRFPQRMTPAMASAYEHFPRLFSIFNNRERQRSN